MSSPCAPNGAGETHGSGGNESLLAPAARRKINYDGGKQSAAPLARQTPSDLEPASDRTLLRPTAGRLFGATAGAELATQ